MYNPSLWPTTATQVCNSGVLGSLLKTLPSSPPTAAALSIPANPLQRHSLSRVLSLELQRSLNHHCTGPCSITTALRYQKVAGTSQCLYTHKLACKCGWDGHYHCAQQRQQRQQHQHQQPHEHPEQQQGLQRWLFNRPSATARSTAKPTAKTTLQQHPKQEGLTWQSGC